MALPGGRAGATRWRVCRTGEDSALAGCPCPSAPGPRAPAPPRSGRCHGRRASWMTAGRGRPKPPPVAPWPLSPRPAAVPQRGTRRTSHARPARAPASLAGRSANPHRTPADHTGPPFSRGASSVPPEAARLAARRDLPPPTAPPWGLSVSPFRASALITSRIDPTAAPTAPISPPASPRRVLSPCVLSAPDCPTSAGRFLSLHYTALPQVARQPIILIGMAQAQRLMSS